MPLYDYECVACQEIYEVKQGIFDKPFEICGECGGPVNRVILTAPMAFVQQDAKTVGQLASRNTKKMGNYELQEKRNEFKEKEAAAKEQASIEASQKLGYNRIKKDPSKGISKETVDKIQKMSSAEKLRYIEKG